MTTFLLGVLIGVLIGVPIGAVLLAAAVWTYVLHDLRDEPAEPNPPRTGDEPMMWRQML